MLDPDNNSESHRDSVQFEDIDSDYMNQSLDMGVDISENSQKSQISNYDEEIVDSDEEIMEKNFEAINKPEEMTTKDVNAPLDDKDENVKISSANEVIEKQKEEIKQAENT